MPVRSWARGPTTRHAFDVALGSCVQRHGASSKCRDVHAASLLPISAFTRVFDALLGEKDRMRGFGRWSLFLNLPNPLTPPSPLREREITIVAHHLGRAAEPRDQLRQCV